MRTAWLVALGLGSGLVAASGAGAQETPRPSNVFGQLFPKPTGENGIEDFVRAGDLVKNCPAWRTFESGESPQTLTARRKVMSEPNIRLALQTLRQGFGKPLRSPHRILDENTLLPEMALFRMLARLLAVEIYVHLADGRTEAAIASLRDGLRLGHLIQGDTLISGLVGVAIDAIMLRSVGDHLEQFSARDCDRLLALVAEWLDKPDPSFAAIASERRFTLKTLEKYRGDPVRMLRALLPQEDRATAESNLIRAYEDNPASALPLFDQAAAAANAYYDGVLANLRRPLWERTGMPLLKNDGSLESELLQLMVADMSLIGEVYGREQARMQLLGLHAAIRRYRWEFDRLPDSLAALRLGRLAIDPFSDQPFSYRKLSATAYDLSSIGPPDRGTDERPPSGERVPIRLSR